MAVTVHIEWSKFFTKTGAEVLDAKPLDEEDSSFERLTVTVDDDVQSTPAPDGATVAIVTARNGDIVTRIDKAIGSNLLGRLCMDGGPRIIPVKANQRLTMRAVADYG